MSRQLLGQDRYDWLVAWVEGHTGIVLGIGAVGLLVIALPVLWVMRPAPHVHGGFVRAEVLATDTSASDETSFVMRARLRLPDGAVTQVRTESLALAQTVRATACLERRVTEDGVARYLLAQPARCAD